jgi:hypothetical protein
MQPQIPNFFKQTKFLNKTNTKKGNLDQTTYKVNPTPSNLTANDLRSNDQNNYGRSKRSSRLDESFDIPQTKKQGKRVKLERSPKVKGKAETAKKTSLNDLKSQDKSPEKVVENFSKSSMKTSATENNEDDGLISSKTKNMIETVLNKKNQTVLATMTSEVNYLNFNKLLQTPSKPQFNNYLSVSNSVATENKRISLASQGIVSSKTLEIIEMLKKTNAERQNRFNRVSLKERTRSESSFSLKFKYEELIKQERELILPPHYKALVNMQNYLDHTINSLKLKKVKKPLYFEDIKSAIEKNYKQ